MQVRAKISENSKAKDKITNLSHELKQIRDRFEEQKTEYSNEHQLVLSSAVQQSAIDRADIARLQQTLEIRQSEMKRMKMLARKILDER